MLMILARLVRSESFWAVAKVRSPHTGPGIRYIIPLGVEGGAGVSRAGLKSAGRARRGITLEDEGETRVLDGTADGDGADVANSEKVPPELARGGGGWRLGLGGCDWRLGLRLGRGLSWLVGLVGGGLGCRLGSTLGSGLGCRLGLLCDSLGWRLGSQVGGCAPFPRPPPRSSPRRRGPTGGVGVGLQPMAVVKEARGS